MQSESASRALKANWISTCVPCSLTIRPDGCGREYRLIVSGEARGQVWYGDFGDACPCLPRLDFLAWYEAHLDVLLYGALHDWEGPDVEEIIFAGYDEDGNVKPE